jgi:hypothetical protein
MKLKKKIHLIKGQKNDLLKNEIGKKIHLKKKNSSQPGLIY